MAVEFERVAKAIYDSKAIMFGDFVLKDLSHSPIYINLRNLRSFPHEKQVVISAYQQMASRLRFDVLADVPTAATPLVSSLADRLMVPQITPRPDIKDHGSGALIDGVYKKGDTALVVDDLVTTSRSKLEAIDVLKSEGIRVRSVMVLIDRQQGGAAELDKRGYTLHSFTTMLQLAGYYRGLELITEEQFEQTLGLLK